MYDPAPAPARRSPSRAGVVTLRVVLPVVAVASVGLLSCVPLFRAAFVRGRWYDWLYAWLCIPMTVLSFTLVATLDEESPGSDIGFALLLLTVLLSTMHFLVVDIRRRPRPADGPARTTAGSQVHGAVIPPPSWPVHGYGASGAHAGPVGPPAPPAHPQAGPVGSGPTPPPGYPAGQQVPGYPAAPRPETSRVDQVRAELDELSDILRKKQDEW